MWGLAWNWNKNKEDAGSFASESPPIVREMQSIQRWKLESNPSSELHLIQSMNVTIERRRCCVRVSAKSLLFYSEIIYLLSLHLFWSEIGNGLLCLGLKLQVGPVKTDAFKLLFFWDNWWPQFFFAFDYKEIISPRHQPYHSLANACHSISKQLRVFHGFVQPGCPF